MDWLGFLQLLGIAVGLAMDAFAVSIGVGLSLAKVTRRHIFRLAFHFGLFQFFMPIIGWLAGMQVAAYIRHFDHWLAFGLLGYVGGKMLWEAFDKPADDEATAADPTRGATLVTLCLATSIDALAVGLSMGLLQVSVWGPSVLIGLVAGILTTVGIRFGHRFGQRLGRWAEVAGGVVLIAIGAGIVYSHWS